MSDQWIKFSVIIPTYNRATFIETTIRSVQNQQYQNWELIIVNDGSTDNTEQIVKTILDERIKYVLIPNAERGAARNAGIRISAGDFVCFLDSDDVLLPNHLSEASNYISKNAEVKIFHHGYEIRNQTDKILFSSKHLPPQLNDELKSNNVVSPNGIFISSAIAKENLFIENRLLAGTEDYELWLRLASKYAIFHHQVLTSILIDHDQRSMKETDIEKLQTRIHLFLKYVEENNAVKTWIVDFDKFKSVRFSYISLHAALSNNKQIAFKYLKLALAMWPQLIVTKRFFIIAKQLIK